MKSVFTIAACAIAGIGVALTLSGCGSRDSAVKDHNGTVEAAPAHQDPNLVQVSSEFAKRIDLKTAGVEKRMLANNLHVTGQIHADVGKEIDVTARFSGRVVKVNVSLGDVVKAGQVLATVDSQENSDLQAELLEAKSKLTIAKAHEERERQIFEEHLHRPPALIQARTRHDEAKVHLELTQAEFERQQGLYKEKIASQKDYMIVQAALAKAKLSFRQAAADLAREERLYKNKAMLKRDLQLAQAETAQAKQRLETLKQRLRFLGMTPGMVQHVVATNEVMGVVPLLASGSGVITHHEVAVGEIIDPGKRAFTITDLSTVVVNADIPEVDLQSVHLGAPVTVTIASHPGEKFLGYVSYVSEHVSADTRTVPIRARLDNRLRKFKSNMFAEIDLKGKPKMLLSVPKTAVQERDGKKIVYVQTDHGFIERPIRVGGDTEQYFEVSAGLREGEQVATQGSLLLKTELTYQHAAK
jgi:RND family efflux transporter MFP subunit